MPDLETDSDAICGQLRSQGRYFGRPPNGMLFFNRLPPFHPVNGMASAEAARAAEKKLR